jgi:signal transduction histidine kinase/CheY-like chemotaxis protein
VDLASIALAALSEFPSAPIVVFDAEARCVAVFGKRDPSAEAIFGEREAIIGRPAEEYMGADAAGFRRTLTSVLASGESASIRSRAALPNGNFVVELTLWPLAGMPLVACQLRNVSEVDRLRQEFDATESRMRAWFEHTAQFVCELAADGTITYVGSRAREFAVEPESLIGSNMRDVARLFPGLCADDASLVTDSLTRFIESPSDWLPHVARARDRDGRMRSFETSGGWYPGPGGERRGLLVFRESLALAEPANAPRFRQSVAPRPIDAVLELAADGTIARVVRLPTDWAGHGEDLVGRDVFSFLHPEEQEQARSTFALVLAGSLGLGRQPSILRWRDAQAGWHWFEARAVAYETGSAETRVLEIARELTPLERSARLHPEENGGLLQRDNLALLAGGVAHDFNNLLSISLGVGDLMAQQLPSDSPLRPYLDEIIMASRQAADLSRQLLAAAGKAAAAPLLPVDLNQVLRSQESLLRTGVPKSVQLELALAGEPLWINADGPQIREVVLNLVVNAGEAIGERRGMIRVATGRIRDLDPPDKQPPSDWALLEVTDDGPGINEATRRQIFEPRFTTKPAGHGLGLAVVGNVVRRHGGRIHVTSADQQGTTFRIEIPLLPERAVQAEREFASKLANPRHEDVGVLIVDDDDRVRRLCAAMLGVAKFRVFEAPDAETARALLEREPEIACAVVDLVLPDGDGLTLIDALRHKRPGLRVVLCSGAVHRIPSNRADLVVLEKPFRYGQLIESVWRALEASS